MDFIFPHEGTIANRDGATARTDEVLGYQRAEEGHFDQAADAFRRALKTDPGNAELHLALARSASENGDIAESFAAYMRHAELSWRISSIDGPRHRKRHDEAQRDHLVALGLAASDAKAGDLFHFAQAERLDGPAVNPANATSELFQAWNGRRPQVVVIEKFLMPEALEKLRRYCAQSTVWKRNYSAGYIGAIPQDGFACPLLAQIAEEIRDIFAPILASYPLQYLGAFKYDSQLSTGTNIHADFSAVNVNFYIAPDGANLDPASGGMRIWDVEARDEAELRRFNGNEAAAVMQVKDALAVVVPHKSNRAIIFRSALFHKTDNCRFANGYLNMRINISLLFGRFGGGTVDMKTAD